jgi:hypothetical protein
MPHWNSIFTKQVCGNTYRSDLYAKGAQLISLLRHYFHSDFPVSVSANSRLTYLFVLMLLFVVGV